MIDIPLSEIELTAVRSQGAGGQNVNKVATAVHLRFDVRASSLSPAVKERLLRLGDRRITSDGVVVIKAQGQRSQEQNKSDAIARLHELVRSAAFVATPRRPTKPSRGSKRRRLQGKAIRSEVKSLRKRVTE